MAHQITIRENGFAEMAFVGQLPWHGLGQQVADGASIAEIQAAAGLDWQYMKGELQYRNGEWHKFPKRSAVYRSDNNEPLSIVSDQYKLVQPADILNFYSDLIGEGGFKMHTAGSLNGGARIWALADCQESALIVPGDRVKSFLLLATSCDGSLGTLATFTAVRVVCANTLAMAVGSKGQRAQISIGHRSTFRPEQVKAQLGIAPTLFANFVETMRAAADLKVGPEFAQFMARTMFPVAVDPETGKESRVSAAETAILELFNGKAKGADHPGVAGTGWGFINAVTEWADSHARARSDDARITNAWFGQRAAIKEKAVELVFAGK